MSGEWCAACVADDAEKDNPERYSALDMAHHVIIARLRVERDAARAERDGARAALQVLWDRAKVIDGDSRFHCPPANVDVNGPLALIQCGWGAEIRLIAEARRVLEEGRP